VANRTYDRARELAEAFQGSAVPFESLFQHLGRADIVISSTGSPEFLISRDRVDELLMGRRQRPMFFVDLAVPRDVDPAVNELDNAFVYDIDDLGQVVEANRRQREREAVWAEKIVDEEVDRTMRRLAAKELAPTIAALEQRLERIRSGEMERYRGRMGTLSDDQQATVEALTRGILNKILHGPITEMKSGAGNPEHGALVQLVRRIFGVE